MTNGKLSRWIRDEVLRQVQGIPTRFADDDVARRRLVPYPLGTVNRDKRENKARGRRQIYWKKQYEIRFCGVTRG